MAEYKSIHKGEEIDEAVTRAFNLSETTGLNSDKIMSQKAVTQELQNKVDKVEGKGLSSSDFTDEEKLKLSSIETGANKTIVVQDLGNSESKVLSQNASSNLFAINNHTHLAKDIESKENITGEFSTMTPSSKRIKAYGGVYKNNIYFFPDYYATSYSYATENDLISGNLTSVIVNESNSNLYLADNTDSETQIYMVSGMLNSGSPNTSMVYSIDTNSPGEFTKLTFPETEYVPKGMKYFKGAILLFLNNGDIFKSDNNGETWSKLKNLKTDLNIDINGIYNISIIEDTLYICGSKYSDTYVGYVVYTNDLNFWQDAVFSSVSRFNNVAKLKETFVLSTSTANKLVTTTDFDNFSVIDGVPSNYIQSSESSLYAMNSENGKIIKSTKDLIIWNSYNLTSIYSNVSYIFGYVGKYVLINDDSDYKRMNYLLDYTEVRPLTISQGGTNATTTEEARYNLEVPINKTITNQMTDFNDYTEVGFYSLYNPLYNVPDTNMSGNYSYSLIVSHGVFKNGTFDIDQIAISQNGDMYIRHYSRSFGIWHYWQRINNTDVKSLEIIKGGTGASSAEEARSNLGIYSKNEIDNKLPYSLPEIPSDSNTYVLKSVNGVLEWSEQ